MLKQKLLLQGPENHQSYRLQNFPLQYIRCLHLYIEEMIELSLYLIMFFFIHKGFCPREEKTSSQRFEVALTIIYPCQLEIQTYELYRFASEKNQRLELLLMCIGMFNLITPSTPHRLSTHQFILQLSCLHFRFNQTSIEPHFSKFIQMYLINQRASLLQLSHFRRSFFHSAFESQPRSWSPWNHFIFQIGYTLQRSHYIRFRCYILRYNRELPSDIWVLIRYSSMQTLWF